MFERYTEGARRAVFFARYEASNLGIPHINTEHLLLGVLREDKGLISQVSVNLNHESAYRDVESRVPPDARKFPTSVDLPLSEDARLALTFAAEEADRLNSKQIGTEHLLLALVRDTGFPSATVLARHGTSLELLRKRVEALPRRGPPRDVRVVQPTPRKSDSIEIHGGRCDLDLVAANVKRLKRHSFFWERRLWRPRDVFFERNGKRFSFDIGLGDDTEKFLLVKGGWQRDYCAICDWELFESEDPAHGAGYWNGRDWICEECYRRFIDGDYFSSTYSELT